MTFRRQQATATVDWAEPEPQFRYQPPPFGYDQPMWEPPYPQQRYNPQPQQFYSQPQYGGSYPQHDQHADPMYAQPLPELKTTPDIGEVPAFLKGEKSKKRRFKIDFNLMGTRPNSTQDFQDAFHKEWIEQEYDFSMNKISMSGLIFGLMFLGSIFFLIGFLVAVNLYGTHKPQEYAQHGYMPTNGGLITARTGVATMNAVAPITNMAVMSPQGMIISGMPSLQNSVGRVPTSLQQQGTQVVQQVARAPSNLQNRVANKVDNMAYGAIQPATGYISRAIH